MTKTTLKEFLNWIVMIIFSLYMIAFCVKPSWYLLSAKYASPCIFLALVILFFNHIDWLNRLKNKDIELYIIIAGVVISGINMILIRSNKGAIFPISDILLILYLSNKIKLSHGQILLPTLTCTGIMLIWFIIKRPAYTTTDFNTNTGAFVCLICTCFSLCGWNMFLKDNVKLRACLNYLPILLIPIVLFYAIRLEARSSTMASIIFLVVYYLLPKKPWTVIIVLLLHLLFPFLYLALWHSGFNFVIPFTDKVLWSGRELVWGEFVRAFLQHPWTGIGSDLARMVPNSPYLDPHHATLDILFIHGIPVFLLALYLLTKRLWQLVKAPASSSIKAACLASIYAILVVSTFENLYITSPYNSLFFLMFAIVFMNQNSIELCNCNYSKKPKGFTS